MYEEIWGRVNNVMEGSIKSDRKVTRLQETLSLLKEDREARLQIMQNKNNVLRTRLDATLEKRQGKIAAYEAEAEPLLRSIDKESIFKMLCEDFQGTLRQQSAILKDYIHHSNQGTLFHTLCDDILVANCFLKSQEKSTPYIKSSLSQKTPQICIENLLTSTAPEDGIMPGNRTGKSMVRGHFSATNEIPRIFFPLPKICVQQSFLTEDDTPQSSLEVKTSLRQDAPVDETKMYSFEHNIQVLSNTGPHEQFNDMETQATLEKEGCASTNGLLNVTRSPENDFLLQNNMRLLRARVNQQTVTLLQHLLPHGAESAVEDNN